MPSTGEAYFLLGNRFTRAIEVRIATEETDKKLGFVDDLHVTWLSFHPDIKFAQNPREDDRHKISSVFNLEAYISSNCLFSSD